jgi:hypothetical protein
MAVEQFVIQVTIVFFIAIAMAVLGVILLVPALFGRLWAAPRRVPVHGWISEDFRKKGYAVVGILFISLGLFALVCSVPATVTIGSGYVSVETSPLWGAGNINVTSSEIASAYVGQIGSDLTIAQQSGNNGINILRNNRGNILLGTFALENGKTAYIASNNPTALIMQLNDGQYVILGTANTDDLASSFSQNVHSLN